MCTEHLSTVPSENEILSSTNDDDFEYMLPPIGAVAFMPDGCPGTIWRVVHKATETWFFLVPGGWFLEHRLIYGARKVR